jgi:hypothetical protein
VAAPGHAITIRRAAEILGEDEKLLWDVITDMEPEHGLLWIYDTDDQQTPAFTPDANTCARYSRSTNATGQPRGPERMVTFIWTGTEIKVGT